MTGVRKPPRHEIAGRMRGRPRRKLSYGDLTGECATAVVQEGGVVSSPCRKTRQWSYDGRFAGNKETDVACFKVCQASHEVSGNGTQVSPVAGGSGYSDILFQASRGRLGVLHAHRAEGAATMQSWPSFLISR